MTVVGGKPSDGFRSEGPESRRLRSACLQADGWKKQLLENAASLFVRGGSAMADDAEDREREAAKLYAKIGQLTVERDFLARRPGR